MYDGFMILGPCILAYFAWATSKAGLQVGRAFAKCNTIEDLEVIDSVPFWKHTLYVALWIDPVNLYPPFIRHTFRKSNEIMSNK